MNDGLKYTVIAALLSIGSAAFPPNGERWGELRTMTAGSQFHENQLFCVQFLSYKPPWHFGFVRKSINLRDRLMSDMILMGLGML